MNDAALEVLVEIADTASGNWAGATAALKSANKRPRRDRQERRLNKPHHRSHLDSRGYLVLPGAAVATPGAVLPLVGLFYLGCLPAAIAELTMPEERWAWAGGLLVLWVALWVVLVAVL